MAHAKRKPRNSLVQEDASLLFDAYKLSNGATVHRLNNMVGAYKGYVQLAQEGSQEFVGHVERMERELRMFIANEKKKSSTLLSAFV